MFIRVGDRFINASNIVEIKVTPAAGERTVYLEDEDREVLRRATPLELEIVTTAQTSEYDSGGDFPEFAHTEAHPYVIRLRGDEAQQLLEAITEPRQHPELVFGGDFR